MGTGKCVASCALFFVFIVPLTSALHAQMPSERQYYARVNTFGVFGAYSANSSHILLGEAENRMLLFFGVSYSRRLILNHVVNLHYNAEFMPIALESDPLIRFVNRQTSHTTGTYTGDLPYPMVKCARVINNYDYTINGITYSGTEVETCYDRQWTMGQAISPAGLQLNFGPKRKAQPFLNIHGGYMFSSKPIPISGAGSFNFMFDMGAGIELYRSKSRSLRTEFRYHHISNDDTAHYNPGIDNGLFQVTYAFGR